MNRFADEPGFPESVRTQCLSPVDDTPDSLLAQIGERLGELDLLIYGLKVQMDLGEPSQDNLTRARHQAYSIYHLVRSLCGLLNP